MAGQGRGAHWEASSPEPSVKASWTRGRWSHVFAGELDIGGWTGREDSMSEGPTTERLERVWWDREMVSERRPRTVGQGVGKCRSVCTEGTEH